MEACTKYSQKMLKLMRAKERPFWMELIQDKKNRIKIETNKTKKKRLCKSKKYFESIIKNPSTKQNKYELDEMGTMVCNPGCMGTEFQDADYSKADLEKKFKLVCKNDNRCDKKTAIAYFKKSRKKLRNGRKIILKDDFYYLFDKKTKAQMIKEGALSGCAKSAIL